MNPIQPRRSFLKRLLMLPLLATPSVAVRAEDEYALDEFPVAGFGFHQGPTVLHRLRAGDELKLVAEPANPHDARAIRVEAFGRHVGYVPRSENTHLARLLAQGASLRARVVRVQPQSAPWEALQVAVSLRVTQAV